MPYETLAARCNNSIFSFTSSGISAAAVKWSTTSYPYDTGNYPSAAQGPAFNLCLGGGCNFVNMWATAFQGNSTDLIYHASGQNNGYTYDHGYFPTIATDTWGNFIEIHQADSVNSPFWYKIGYDNGTGAQYMLNSASQNDWGMSPVIAVHGHNCNEPNPHSAAFGDIIQVHQGGTNAGPLWMNFGEATNIDCNNGGSTPRWGGVQWLGAQPYSTGFYPSVALNALSGSGPAMGNACILEAHQDGPGFGIVRWQSGGLSYSGSSWSYGSTASGSFGSGAQHASVCIYDGYNGGNYVDTAVMVLELDDGSLMSIDGPIGNDVYTNKSCVWTPLNYQTYDRGAYPRISCESGTLSGRGGVQGVEVHQGSSSTSAVPLWTRGFTE